MLGSGCGSVGRAVAYATRGLQFKSLNLSIDNCDSSRTAQTMPILLFISPVATSNLRF